MQHFLDFLLFSSAPRWIGWSTITVLSLFINIFSSIKADDIISNNFLIFVPLFAEVSIYDNLLSSQNLIASACWTCLLDSLSTLFPANILKAFSGTLSPTSFSQLGKDKKVFKSI